MGIAAQAIQATGEKMKQGNHPPQTYSIGQVAKRWAISPERVRQLVDNGQLAGAFTIPSAGRFGKAMRIPVETVLAAEQKWAATPTLVNEAKRPRPRSSCELAFKHFPELAAGPLEGNTEV